jgi:hypothetical protein
MQLIVWMPPGGGRNRVLCDLRIPILVGVNGLNLAAFLAFAGEGATALPTDVASVVHWCRQSIVAETA